MTLIKQTYSHQPVKLQCSPALTRNSWPTDALNQKMKIELILWGKSGLAERNTDSVVWPYYFNLVECSAVYFSVFSVQYREEQVSVMQFSLVRLDKVMVNIAEKTVVLCSAGQ